jgi:hypothetical protein
MKAKYQTMYCSECKRNTQHRRLTQKNIKELDDVSKVLVAWGDVELWKCKVCGKTSQKVDRIEVKRCFVASEKVKELLEKSEVDLQTMLSEAQNEVLKMSESELERKITWSPRLKTYNEHIWFLEKCSIDDLGVWYEAAGLPGTWCIGSLRETVGCVLNGKKEIARISKYSKDKRGVEKIPKIVKIADKIVSNPLQIPIAVIGGTFRRPSPCHKMKWDIDDGNLRAIAFAIKRYESFDVYVGKEECS